MTAKVSVCVPIYGVEKYIENCATSLFEQDYENIEYVFVDDCTKDKSIEILENVISNYPSIQEKVKIIRHNKNRGLSAARNTALEQSMGDFILPIDSDDYLENKDSISKIMKCARDNNSDVVIYTMKHIFSNGKKSTGLLQRYDSKEEYIDKIIRKEERRCCLCGGMYKKKLFTENNIYSIEELNFGEDYAVTPRILHCAENISFCSDAVYCYTHISTVSYTKRWNDKHIEDLYRAVNILNDYFKNTADYNKYNDSLRIVEYKIKGELLFTWANTSNDINSLEKICNLPSPNKKDKKYIEKKYLIAFKLTNCTTILKVYVRIGVWIKNLRK